MLRHPCIERGRVLRSLAGAVLTAGMLASTAAPAHAWSPAGHMALGAITYAELERIDAEALAEVLELLTAHPHFGQLIDGPADRELEPETRRIAMFARAGRWADDVRRAPWDEYSRPTWHYVNFRYHPPSTLTQPRSPARDGYLLWALEENLRRLDNDFDTVRAIALTWLFHLVADLHQPLHDIALVDDARPEGDRGGNLTFVRVAPGAETLNLHQLWDGLVHDDENVVSSLQRARELLDSTGARADAVAVDVDGDRVALLRSWSEEGARLAIDAVYLRGALETGVEGDGAVVPEGYMANARETAERLAVLGSIRLAHLLARLF